MTTECIKTDWTEFAADVEKLAGQIEVRPDIVVGIVRGGLVPARILSTLLAVRDMYCLTVKKVGGDRRVTSSVNEDIRGKAVLLVEDVLETGRSLLVAQRYLASIGAVVKTACLYTMPQTELRPDYSLGVREALPTFPWE